MFTLLKNKNARNFFVGLMLSRWGDSFSFIAFLFLLLQLTHSNTIISLFMVLHYLPGTVIGLSAGHLFDRHSKKKLLISSYIASAIFVLLAIPARHSPLALLILALLLGISYGIYVPVQRAYLAELLPPQEMKDANRLVQLSDVLGKTLGFLCAGAAITLFGTSIAFLADGVSFICIAVCVTWTIPIEKHSHTVPTVQLARQGARWFFSNRELFLPSLFFAMAWLATGTLFALEVPYAKEYLSASNTAISFLFALTTVGSFIAVRYLGNNKQHGHFNMVILASLVETIFVLGYGLSNHMGFACVFILGYGFFLTVRHVAIATYYHERVAKADYGKAFAYQQALANLAMFTGMGLAGPISDAFTSRQVIVGACIITFIGIGVLKLIKVTSKEAIISD